MIGLKLQANIPLLIFDLIINVSGHFPKIIL